MLASSILTLFADLLLELVLDEVVREVRVLLREHLGRAVLERVDAVLELEEVALGELALFQRARVSATLGVADQERGADETHLALDIVGDGRGLLLDDVDLGLDVGADVLEVTDDGAVDGAGKVGVALGEELGRVADVVQDCLPSLGREDVALVERDVDGLGESGSRPGRGVLDVDETLRDPPELSATTCSSRRFQLPVRIFLSSISSLKTNL
jgi:hypothetical protein